MRGRGNRRSLELVKGVAYHSCTDQELVDYASGNGSNTRNLIVAVDKSYESVANKLCHQDAYVMLHDDDTDTAKLFDYSETRFLCTSQLAAERFKRFDLSVEFVRPPYVRTNTHQKLGFRRIHCCSMTSIRTGHNFGWLINANQRLRAERRVFLYGDCDDKFASCFASMPRWKANYKGNLPNTKSAAVDTAMKSKYVVDTTPADMRGMRYTILESWDGGAVTILHKSWANRPDSQLSERDFVSFDDEASLYRAILTPSNNQVAMRNRCFNRLADYAPSATIPHILKALDLE